MTTIETFPDATIGDSVEVPGGWHGTVMYVGPVEGREGTFLGIDLIDLDADKGRNNGSYKGVKYFTTKSATSGMFAPQGRCRIIDNGVKKERNSDAQVGRHLHIRPNSRMRSVSGMSAVGSPTSSRQVSGDYGDMLTAANQQRLLNENARLSQELEDVRVKLSEVQTAKAIQAQEMDELMSSVAELETFIGSQNSNANSTELEQLREHLADREAKIQELRREAEERRTEFRQVTEHQQATIEELKTFHEYQIAEFAEKHADLEDRLLSSGTSGMPAGVEAEDMERQITEMTEMFDVLTEEQARARLDIDTANDRIQELEKENDRLLDELAEAKLLLAQKPINGPRSPSSRRVSGIEHLPDSHPQKRQTIGFLETELRRLQEENDTLQKKAAASDAAELSDLRSKVQALEKESLQAKQLQAELDRERSTRREMEDQHAQMEETLERTIMEMNFREPATNGHTKANPVDLRSPRASRAATPMANMSNEPSSDSALRCEYCGAVGHDIINCSNVFGSAQNSPTANRPAAQDDDEEY